MPRTNAIGSPGVSVIIPWCNRPELTQTLVHNAGELMANDAEVLIICAGQTVPVRLPDEIPDRFHVRIIELPCAGSFNKSECLNVGAWLSRAEHLFLLDADIILELDFLAQALSVVRTQACFVTVADVVESNPTLQPDRWNPNSFIRQRTVTTELITDDGRTATIQYKTVKHGVRTGSGLMVIAKNDLLAVNGFNSMLHGWGFEDYDIQIRVQLARGVARVMLGQVVHLSHLRSEDAATSVARNTGLGYDSYERGNLLGTLDLDAARWEGRLVELSA